MNRVWPRVHPILGLLLLLSVIPLLSDNSEPIKKIKKKKVLHQNSKAFQINQHFTCHLSKAYSLGTLDYQGTDRTPSIYFKFLQLHNCTAFETGVNQSCFDFRMVLDNEIQTNGMVLPFAPNIYRPMLDR